MFDKTNIVDRLLNGEDAQAIANELADVLNSAIEEASEKNKNSEKTKDLVAAYNGVVDIIEKHYHDLYSDELRKIDGDDLVEIVDNMVKEAREIKSKVAEIEGLLNNLSNDKTIKDTDPINEFLAKYVNC